MKYYVESSIFLVNSFTFITEKCPISYGAPNKTGMDIPLSYVYYQLALPPAIEYLKETKKVRTDADLAPHGHFMRHLRV